MVDFNGDGKADFCRAVGDGPSGEAVACTLSSGDGFGSYIQSSNLDWGREGQWVDFDGDRRADYCRLVGETNFRNSRLACNPSRGSWFGATAFSALIDWGYEGSGSGRGMVDVSADGRADYCRLVGNSNFVDGRIECTISTPLP